MNHVFENGITQFIYHDGTQRWPVHAAETYGTLWLSVDDTRSFLELDDPIDVFLGLVESEDVLIAEAETSGLTDSVEFVTLSGLRRMTADPDSVAASRFRRWVFSEVMPFFCKLGKLSPGVAAELAEYTDFVALLAETIMAMMCNKTDSDGVAHNDGCNQAERSA